LKKILDGVEGIMQTCHNRLLEQNIMRKTLGGSFKSPIAYTKSGKGGVMTVFPGRGNKLGHVKMLDEVEVYTLTCC
jgi:hypothetical protein